MITLGQASNYSVRQVFRHLFAWGTRKDFEGLRADLAAKYGVEVESVALYHTGRSALAVALRSAAEGKRLPVIIPGLTCIAVVRAVKAAGCVPVFVDIRADNLGYDYSRLEQKLQELGDKKPVSTSIKNGKSIKTIDKTTKVCYNKSIILVQNTLGITWDVSKIQQIAKKHGAALVEDLAHSAGRKYSDGRETGTVGEAAALSFGKGKAIDTISGGAVILRGAEAEQPEKAPNYFDGQRDRWYPMLGLLARKLGKVGQLMMGVWVKLHLVQRSADAVLDTGRRLTYWQAKLARWQLANLPEGRLRDYCLVHERERVLAELKQRQYNLAETWYDTPVSPKRYADEADFPTEECPETVRIAQQIINFPTWYEESRLAEAYKIARKYEVK